jgi:hypothetical protein
MLKQVLEVMELLDDSSASGLKVARLLRSKGLEKVEVQTIKGTEGATDFVKITVPGTEGKQKGGRAPTLGIIGRLGGVGARPRRIGIVSDADGAVTALSCALKLADMAGKGDVLKGDVVIATHVCPRSPITPHEPVPFMGSPVDMRTMNKHEVDPAMDGILSIDATKGNRILNSRGVAITPTVKEGYILRVSEDLLDLLSWTTGRLPQVVAITTQDITPYGNGLFHLNSIMQPCTATSAPVVGVALTAEAAVPGCASGCNQEVDIAEAARFSIEVAKGFTEGKCRLYDGDEFRKIVGLYGTMAHLQTLGGTLCN